MNDISPIAWVFIGFIIIFTILINVWLLSSKNKSVKSKNNNIVFSRIMQTLKDPFADEKNNLQKLSEATAKLRDKSVDLEE